MSAISVTHKIELSPQELADGFWSMDAEQQADFFAALEHMAGVKLCMQMAAVVMEIQERSDRGDHDAQNGFQTMLSHAEHYCEGATDFRVWNAQRLIGKMADKARKSHA